jgi:hypothetical protein
VNSQVLKDDSLLLRVVQELPPGWTAKIVDSVFSIEYKDSTWVVHGNWINAHQSQIEQKNDSVWIKTNGRKVRTVFKFQLIDKMDNQSIEKLKASEKKYQGYWAHSIYNAQHFTLLQFTVPEMNDEYNAVWPQDTGAWNVNKLLLEHLSIK